ncbi:monooxygenase FAD-binding (plasmid) [Rhizobium leguminosarum bv. trifolii WSM1325]|uniref:Monooxygenase FAD-binding n=1 Tax=Rhizobium leguminosarum bv. trifolii (strain WSM1325) TaxID=395491 RepID=C6B8V2_RHILS|nr:bifunctional 3-(3-hydroxy-phenyl)propionate/3-hydroxycinnamic acid hydroxylase [Rhizobium leguminosarum]ACS60340.1 monooxygenase FAD-binding [Rhizobium leguminosarum bv. trifolii WSM1325]MBY2944448.1 bifunctional 3-(3-hydroxy-phenyl)propionate/3-hydroxycinnamic acid hydroxylase [Rhizobium leguminosarum]
MTEYDVIIVGYGPAGKVLARQLVDGGHKVAVVERWPEAYPLPRAIGYDHEIKRIFYAMGIARDVAAISRGMGHYVWYNADWKVLIDIDETRESISGGATGYTFNQPELEKILHEDLRRRDGISYHLGMEAIAARDAGDHIEVEIARFDAQSLRIDHSETRLLTGRYLVGCDGANSFVRRLMDVPVIDHGFDEAWLVVDVMPNDLEKLHIPDAAQWCNPARPTTIVPSGVRNRRFEFMLLPGEEPTQMCAADEVWELLAPWLSPDDGHLIRSATYRFRSLLTRGWRKGQMLLAGDAAHLMPPFMGQGMCAGLRDAWNLGWKLGLVLDGSVAESLLDSYEAERSPHVEAVIRISMAMGQVICVPDPEAARRRDEAFFAGIMPPPPVFPPLSDGIIARDADGKPMGFAGELLPHDDLVRDSSPVRLDDLAGRNFVLVTNVAVDDARLARLGVRQVLLGGAGWRDINGRLSHWLESHDAAAYLARPDFYAFGSAANSKEIDSLLEAFEGMMRGRDHVLNEVA